MEAGIGTAIATALGAGVSLRMFEEGGMGFTKMNTCVASRVAGSSQQLTLETSTCLVERWAVKADRPDRPDRTDQMVRRNAKLG